MHPDLKAVRRKHSHHDSRIKISEAVDFGPGKIRVIAGPCAIESHDQLLKIARTIQKNGAHILRAGAYKPRTSPYSFQGLGDEGLLILNEVRRKLNLAVITEILDVRDLGKLLECSDMIQV